MLGLRVRGRGGRDQPATVAAPKSAFLWGSTPFLCARAKKRGGTGSRSRRLLPRETAHTHNPPTSAKAPPPSRAKMSPVYRGSSAHADGGAAGVKKRFSLAARHRFFWQDKRNGVEGQQGPTTPTQRIGAPAPSQRQGSLAIGPVRAHQGSSGSSSVTDTSKATLSTWMPSITFM